jgi:hypothetical protein
MPPDAASRSRIIIARSSDWIVFWSVLSWKARGRPRGRFSGMWDLWLSGGNLRE